MTLPTYRDRSDKPTRRQLLQIGALGGLLDLPGLLWASSPNGAGVRRSGPERSCILIVQEGGLSHIDSWDPKPAAPETMRGPYQPIRTSVPGFQVGELMPGLARLADRYCLIRSMTHGNSGHRSGMKTLLSGRSKPPEIGPYFGSALSKLRPVQRGIFSYVWLQPLNTGSSNNDDTYRNAGFLGPDHAPFVVGNTENNPAAPNFPMGGLAFEPPPDVSLERTQSRQKLLRNLDPLGRAEETGTAGAEFQKFQEQAFDLTTSRAVRTTFDLEREPSSLRDRYGRYPLGQNLLLARRMIEAGVRLVTVNAYTGEPAGSKPGRPDIWDMHGVTGQGSIFGTTAWGLGFALPRADASVSALLEDLNQRGLLESTLVVLVGEFGRTPLITTTKEGIAGRDHYSRCYSALLAGAGIRGGTVYGASDKIGAHVKEKPVSPEDFAATLYHALGVPPETGLSRPDGFTQPVSAGQPILDLFG